MNLKIGLLFMAVCAPTFGLAHGLTPKQKAAPNQRMGITKEVVHLDATHRLWIYRPKPTKKLCPLILIAPAGSPLFCGKSLAQGDVPEFLPYAQAGCVVVAYDVSGPFEPPEKNPVPAIHAFLESDAGTKDAQRALTYALKSIKEIDPLRVVAIGHSSAATIAIQVTEAYPRIKACIAYAPVVDVPEHMAKYLGRVERVFPGFTEAIRQTSPLTHANRIRCPLLLFHANDDSVVAAGPIRHFASIVRSAKLVETPSGDHYDSMIKVGIPTGIKWLSDLKIIGK